MRGLFRTGRGVRVTAAVGVLLLGTGVVSAAAEETPEGAEAGVVATVEPTDAATAEVPESEVSTDDSTGAQTSEPTPPADETQTTPEPEYPQVPYWAVATIGESQELDWRDLFTRAYPEAGTPTFVEVSTPTYGTVEVPDPASGAVLYHAPTEMPATDDAFSVTAVGADGVPRTISYSVVLVFAPTSWGATQITAQGTPITFAYKAPERTADGGTVVGPTMTTSSPRHAAGTTTRVVVPAMSLVGDRYTWIGATDPAQGSASLDTTTGKVTFTPAPDFVGVAEFPATITGAGGEVSSTIRVAVLRTLTDGTLRVSTPVDVPVAIDVVPAAGGADLAYPGEHSTPAHGTLDSALPAYGLTYFPAAGFTGRDTFTVQVRDEAGQTATVRVEVGVGELPRTGVRTAPLLIAAGTAVLAGLGLVLLRRRVSAARV